MKRTLALLLFCGLALLQAGTVLCAHAPGRADGSQVAGSGGHAHHDESAPDQPPAHDDVPCALVMTCGAAALPVLDVAASGSRAIRAEPSLIDPAALRSADLSIPQRPPRHLV